MIKKRDPKILIKRLFTDAKNKTKDFTRNIKTKVNLLIPKKRGGTSNSIPVIPKLIFPLVQ